MPIDSQFLACIPVLEEAGGILRTFFQKQLATQRKGDLIDVVTEADFASEKLIIEKLRALFPEHNVFGEESGLMNNGSEYVWYIDPLDGTFNFTLGVPMFSITLILFHNDEAVFSAIHLPMKNVTYYAQQGKGAYLNGDAIRVNTKNDPASAAVATSLSYHHTSHQLADVFRSITDAGIRRTLVNWCISQDLCLFAEGRIHAVISGATEIYDFAAGKLIAREAEAMITNFQGQPDTDDMQSRFVATNGTSLHNLLLGVLKNFPE